MAAPPPSVTIHSTWRSLIGGSITSVVMVGGGGGQIKGGQHLDYSDNENRQMCRLLMSMAAKMGVQLDKFGDATEPLAEV